MRYKLLLAMMFLFTLGVVSATPTMINATISPTIAYKNDTLLGYCNATAATNVSYDYIWYKNSINVSQYNHSDYGYCYQNKAEVATCSNAVGSYSLNNCPYGGYITGVYDGSWNVDGLNHCNGVAIDNVGTLILNYSKPSLSDKTSLWQVKDALGNGSSYNVNISIIDSCWNYDSNTLNLKMTMTAIGSGGGNKIEWMCFNGTWVVLRNLNSTNYSTTPVEQSMWWNIVPSTNNSQSILINIANLSSNFSHFDNITFSCRAFDGNYSSWLNSSVLTVSNSVPTQPTPSFSVGSYRGDTFTASCSGSTDVDSDSLSYFYQFESNLTGTVLQAYSTNASYSVCSSNVACNKTGDIRMKCKSFDGFNYSSETSYLSRDILNTAPTTPYTPSIATPAGTAYKNDTFTSSAGSGSTDIDPEDTVSYTYQFVSGDGTTILQAYGANSYAGCLVDSSCNKTYGVKVQTNATDGIATTVSALSVTKSIANTAPTAPTALSLNSSIFVGQSLVASASGSSDIDSDPLTYYYEFYNVNTSTTKQAYSTVASYVVAVSDAHDIIRVRSKAFDGAAYSLEKESNITVNNSAPSVSPYLSYSSLTKNSVLSCVGNGSDADNDTLTYFYLWFRNGVANVTTQNITVDSKLQNYTCQVTPYDGFVNGTAINSSTVTSVNSLHVFNSVGTSPSSVLMFNNFTFQANVSDIDNDISSINFSVKFPNGTLTNYTSTLTGGLYVTQSFIATNGTYNVSVLGDDGTSSNFTFIVNDTLTVQPSSFSFAQSSGNNYTFAVTINHDSNENLSFIFSNDFNASLFNLSYSSNPFYTNGSGSMNVTVAISSNVSSGSYSGNVSVNRSIDGRVTVIPLNITVTNLFGVPQLSDSNTSAVSMVAGSSASVVYNLSNVGTYNLTNCTAVLSGTFSGFSFWSSSLVDVPINQSKSFTVFYTAPAAGTYSGYLNINCIATPTGGLNSLVSSNQPLHNLVVSPYVAPSGGGGGGSSTPSTPSNVSSFTLVYERGGTFANPVVSPGDSISLGYFVSSLVTDPLDLKVSCLGDSCKFVSIPQSSLRVFSGVREGFSVVFNTPSDASYNSVYSFDIVVSNNGESRVVKNEVVVSKVSDLLTKLSTFNVPSTSSPAYLFTAGGFLVPKLFLYLFSLFSIVGLLSFKQFNIVFGNRLFVAIVVTGVLILII